jgi:hypothetical protein
MSRRKKKPPPHPPSQPALVKGKGPTQGLRLKDAWSNRPRWYRVFVIVGTATCVLLLGWLIWRDGELIEKDYPLPPYSETRFLNAGQDAQYVGAQACADCHRGNHQSYLLTAHSRAFAEVDLAVEPPDGSFSHPRSGRSYRVYRRDGKMRHEEVVRSEGKDVARVDLPIRYRVGSGDFARTYVVEVDGFLHESPITWYASKKQWGMSPGYDVAEHMSFERPIKAACLVCHAGRVEAGETVHRPIVHEKAIGCESCHGPGSRHVELRKACKTQPADDWTIVNPGKLPRAQLESICAACHLMGPARVYLRGRQAGDYRPGMPLDDYCIDYRLDSGNEAMTVVGHMDQLRRSACYQKNQDLTCLTCHDPHARETPKDTAAHYRQKCLTCHTASACKLEESHRRKQSATDNCTACHMPRGGTDIPHVAFTHHRIGIHAPKPTADTKRIPELTPTADVSRLSLVDEKRNLGLAYLQAARQMELAQYKGVFAERARMLLEAVQNTGLREAETAGALADLYSPLDPVRSQSYARQAVQAKNASAEMRANALILLATFAMKNHDEPTALRALKELTPLRRSAEDWALLGMCHRLQNEPREALIALDHALSIRPDLPAVHLQMAEVQRRVGNDRGAKEHEEKARLLQRR